MANISPKGRYVVGKSASGAGLTATVVRDEYLKGWSLEAGAMVLANKGLVCIDELEKMDPQDRSAMHEAMEQQTVTISKANVQATLKAATSVLAAANPKFGRFDPYQSIAQQIDLPPSLINRFDVIFTMRDIPNHANDDKVANHILKSHKEGEEDMVIPRDLYRKYVAYAKQRVKPVLSNEAIQELRTFYVELRNKPVSSDSAMRPIPISARQLQALVRMSEASAKLRLSEIVTAEHSKEAIELMKYYLMQVGYDYETKTFDIDKISGKFSNSQRSKIMLVKETITALESKMGKMIPYEELSKELEDKMNKDELDEIVDKLLKSNEIYRPKRGYLGVF
jgi:replicative DNA helicase Mcm